MWRGTGSLPAGQSTCLECRRARPKPKPVYVPKPPKPLPSPMQLSCAVCAKTVITQFPSTRFCKEHKGYREGLCNTCGSQTWGYRYKPNYCSDECRPSTARQTRKPAECRRCLTPITRPAMLCLNCRITSNETQSDAQNGRNTHHKRAVRAGVRYERINRRKVYERDGWKCGICHKAVDPACKWPDLMSPSLDHIIPIAHGGDHVYSNVQLAHWKCNTNKAHRRAGDQLRLDLLTPASQQTIKGPRGRVAVEECAGFDHLAPTLVLSLRSGYANRLPL